MCPEKLFDASSNAMAAMRARNALAQLGQYFDDYDENSPRKRVTMK